MEKLTSKESEVLDAALSVIPCVTSMIHDMTDLNAMTETSAYLKKLESKHYLQKVGKDWYTTEEFENFRRSQEAEAAEAADAADAKIKTYPVKGTEPDFAGTETGGAVIDECALIHDMTDLNAMTETSAYLKKLESKHYLQKVGKDWYTTEEFENFRRSQEAEAAEAADAADAKIKTYPVKGTEPDFAGTETGGAVIDECALIQEMGDLQRKLEMGQIPKIRLKSIKLKVLQHCENVIGGELGTIIGMIHNDLVEFDILAEQSK